MFANMLKVVLYLSILSLTSAATFRRLSSNKLFETAHKEGCYIKEIEDVVPFGTVVKPIGTCIRITCGSGRINYATCGSVYTDDPKCYITKGDLTKPYPYCCPNIECESDNVV